MTEVTRRPISARNTKWAVATARWLARIGLRPNQISILSTVFGALAGLALWAVGTVDCQWLRVCYCLGAALAMQLRLLCNLFDGMVAVEGGMKSRSGEIYNELPDRFSDAFILAGAGYVSRDLSWLPVLGWSAAVLALITAYVRTLGAAAGAGQHFLGPMAKQHRMAVMTAASVVGAAAGFYSWQGEVLGVALAIINVGCLVTIGRRCRRIVVELESR